jgi:membrane protein implicated in regulation of membrane protease activity
LKRNRIVLVLWVAVAAGAVGTGRDMLYNLWYLLTVVLAISFAWAWTGVRWVQVERHTRTTRSQVGKVAEERFVVHNRAPLPKLWLRSETILRCLSIL